jgi:hypothetical protein
MVTWRFSLRRNFRCPAYSQPAPETSREGTPRRTMLTPCLRDAQDTFAT